MFFKKPKQLHQEDQQEMLKILETIKSTVAPDTELIYSYFESVEKLVEELDELIEDVKAEKLKVLEDLSIHFAPTSGFQELSLQNGWSKEYLKLANRFDRIYKKYN